MYHQPNDKCYIEVAFYDSDTKLNSIPVLCGQILAYMQDIKGHGTLFILWTIILVLEALDSLKSIW